MQISAIELFKTGRTRRKPSVLTHTTPAHKMFIKLLRRFTYGDFQGSSVAFDGQNS